MRKCRLLLVGILAVLGAACDKHDPILPGERSAIFNSSDIHTLDSAVPNLPDNIATTEDEDCPYRLDRDNTIWDGERKIFTGFATDDSIDGERKVYCKNNFAYAGLTTGEVIKVNPKNRQIIWIADIFSPTNMMGGASVLDIVAPIVFDENSVYVGGLGNAFCKINDKNGKKNWCVDISVEKPFIIANDTAFVLGTDKSLYAVRLKDGAVYWRTSTEKSATLKYENKILSVGREKFNAETGKEIK